MGPPGLGSTRAPHGVPATQPWLCRRDSRAHRGGMCPGMSCHTRCQRARLWPPALPRHAGTRWRSPAAPPRPRRTLVSRTGQRGLSFPQPAWDFCSHGSLPVGAAVGEGLSLCGFCLSPSGQGRPSSSALVQLDTVMCGDPAEPGPVMISFQPRYSPTRAILFLHFTDGEEELGLHKEAKGTRSGRGRIPPQMDHHFQLFIQPPNPIPPGIRDAASRLVPWPSPPEPCQPACGAGRLQEGFVGAGRVF